MSRLGVLAWGVGSLGLGSLALSGCLNPNSYGTPRTTPVGRVQHSLAAEAIGYRARYPAPDSSNLKDVLPSLPTYTLRVGLSDEVDLGVRVSNLVFGTDVKWNFIKSDVFDLAVAPSVQAFYSWPGAGARHSGYVHVLGTLPLLFGFNASEALSIVPALGVAFAGNVGSLHPNNQQERVSSAEGVFVRAGVGVDFRMSPKFAVHPELTFLKSLPKDGEPEALFYALGVGFNFGALPRY